MMFACKSNHGHRLESEELNVYYLDLQHEDKARELGKFFKDQELLGSKKLHVQLRKVDREFQLLLIRSKNVKIEDLDFATRKTLLDLQQKIKSEVFPEHAFRLLIADEQFEVLYDINS